MLQESASAMLVTLGLALAASRRVRLRQIGWALVCLGVLGQLLWTWSVVAPHTVAAGHNAAHLLFHEVAGSPYTLPCLVSTILPLGDGPLDDAQRERLVEAAYRQYQAELFRFAIRHGERCGADTMLAENAVQDTFAALMDPREDAVWQRDTSGFRAYLFRSIKLRLTTVLRSEDRRATHEAAAADDTVTRLTITQSPATQQSAGELVERIRQGLLQCPPRMAEAFYLVHECGLSHAEAAAVMGISPKTVSAMLIKVARRLVPYVQDFLADGPPPRKSQQPRETPRREPSREERSGEGEAVA